MAKQLRVALLQLKVVKDKKQNVEHAMDKIRQVVKDSKPKLVVLPECFNCPFSPKYYAEYAENVPDGYTSERLSTTAKELGIYIVAGTIPEKGDRNTYYNTCTVWSPTGALLGKYRKLHLFDVDVTGHFKFRESDGFTPGDQFLIVNIENRKVGIAICHDVRFEEMARIYRNEGCEMLIYPVAYEDCFGEWHYELMHRSRANDNQLFVLTTAVARDETSEFISWGHSLIVDPWGRVTHCAKQKEEIIVADLDFTQVEQVRKQIPVFSQRRIDMYCTERKKH